MPSPLESTAINMLEIIYNYVRTIRVCPDHLNDLILEIFNGEPRDEVDVKLELIAEVFVECDLVVVIGPHGVCCGFEVMQSHESLKHPFEIFFTRFETPLSIIYDNSCKLHQYILNRQPSHFKNTSFFVDRFHWRGHGWLL